MLELEHVLAESRFFLTVADDDTGDFNDIQAALEALPASGGTIFVKPGAYTTRFGLRPVRTGTELLISPNATIQANGGSVSTLITPYTTGLSRIRIVGGKWLQTSATLQGTAFDFSDVPNCYFAPNRIENFNLAIKMYDTANTTFYNKYENIQIFDCNNGIDIGGSQANHNKFESIRIRPKTGGAGTGINISDARGLTFDHCNVEPSTGTGITGISLDGTSRENVFLSCWIENNANGVVIASGATRNTFIGSTITGNSTDLSDSGTNTVFINTNRTGTTMNRLGQSNQNRIVSAKTADYTVLSTDSDTFFTNAGATGAVNFTLPTTTPGLTYTFEVNDAQTLTITAPAGSTIRNAATVSATGGTASASTVGNLIRLVAITSTRWVTESVVGTWTIT